MEGVDHAQMSPLPPQHHQKVHVGSKMPPYSKHAQLGNATKRKTGPLAGGEEGLHNV